jgi:hypothetical protein
VSSGWDKIIGGWQANFIFAGQTGQRFSVEGNCIGGCASGTTTAVLLGDPFANLSPGEYIDGSAFVEASANVADSGFPLTTCVVNLVGNQVCYGNTRRNSFVGPGYFRTDFSLFKNTRITERVTTQFGIEFFNLFNHNDHIVPSNNLNNGDFGQFTTSFPPRTIQYRLKVLF